MLKNQTQLLLCAYEHVSKDMLRQGHWGASFDNKVSGCSLGCHVISSEKLTSDTIEGNCFYEHKVLSKLEEEYGIPGWFLYLSEIHFEISDRNPSVVPAPGEIEKEREEYNNYHKNIAEAIFLLSEDVDFEKIRQTIREEMGIEIDMAVPRVARNTSLYMERDLMGWKVEEMRRKFISCVRKFSMKEKEETLEVLQKEHA